MQTDLSQLLSHLHRSHFGKMVAVLMYHTGIEELAAAEDIVQEAFTSASDKWRRKMPDQPEAWLYATIRNIAYNTLRKNKRKQVLEGDLIVFEPKQADEQDLLRILFACLQPSFPPKVQLVVVLRYVCGFRIKRIAALLASNEEAISKILYRWRTQIGPDNFVLPETLGKPGEQKVRMALKVLYVMFTEGYQLSQDGDLEEETLCEDALSLLQDMMNMGIVANGDVKALYALLLYHLARAKSRTNEAGELAVLSEQDRSNWNKEMIGVANHYLLLSQRESQKTSSYQLEAAIAFKHTQALRYEETDWDGIVALYQKLVTINASPFIKIGQAAALYFAGKEDNAISILNQLMSNPFFHNHHLMHCFWARIYSDHGDDVHAFTAYKKALNCPVNAYEKKFIEKKMHALAI